MEGHAGGFDCFSSSLLGCSGLASSETT